MTDLPEDIAKIDANERFFYENAFYLTSSPGRLAKQLCHYELFKLSMELPGDMAEFGVFKGASLCRFIKMRDIFMTSRARKVIAFDVFGEFPEADDNKAQEDMAIREIFVSESGNSSISAEKLTEFLAASGVSEGVVLIRGDVSETLPKYLEENQQTRFALVNIDVDLYVPTRDCLYHLYDRMVRGGVVILDDYHGFPGATKAIDEFLEEKKNIAIKKMPFCSSPSFFIKP